MSVSAVPAVARAMHGRRAGVVSRFLADGIDLLVVVASLFGVYLAVSAARFLIRPRRFSWPEISGFHLGTLGWLLLIAYLTIGWANTGRTFGKTILGLRAVGMSGGRLGLGRAFVRALLCAAVPIGLFWCVVSDRNASIQDLIVRSAVVYDWEPKLPRVETAPSAPARTT
ncbi:MAG TPA: RDD family protein [Actinomycetota bacterium]